MFIGGTDFEAETPILWPPDKKSWLIWKDPDAGKDWRQKEKGITKDEMVGWNHWLNEHGCVWTPGVGDGLRSLECCSSRGCKESNTIERLNWTEPDLFCIFSMLVIYFRNSASFHWRVKLETKNWVLGMLITNYGDGIAARHFQLTKQGNNMYT